MTEPVDLQTRKTVSGSGIPILLFERVTAQSEQKVKVLCIQVPGTEDEGPALAKDPLVPELRALSLMI